MLIFYIESLLFFLYMFQLNGYKPTRYWKFLKRYFLSQWYVIILAFLNPTIYLVLSFMKRFLGPSFKKPFVFTSKALRLIFVLLTLTTLGYWKLEAYLVVFMPVFILLSWLILKPIEFLIEKKFYQEAFVKIRSYPNLISIGITGSYGKTSIKHILYYLLKPYFKVLMTPGSVNTLMGVVRIIREELKSSHEIFICEMGAKYKGNIQELCSLVKPKIGIISYIGVQHLDIFGSEENILKTKLELAEGSEERIFNGDSPFLNEAGKKFKAKMYSMKDKSDMTLKNYTFSEGKTYFTVVENNKEIALETSLLGKNHLSNILPALLVARNLGLSWEQIEFQIKNLPMIAHRLELKEVHGLKILDNAFNSNPLGAEDALSVLKSFQKGRKIVITPGFIELGDLSSSAHEKFGKQIAEVADKVILVGKSQTQDILRGLEEKEFLKENIYVVTSLQEGQKILKKITQVGDILLFENDLTDDYQV